jgi:hypothetical protein
MNAKDVEAFLIFCIIQPALALVATVVIVSAVINAIWG